MRRMSTRCWSRCAPTLAAAPEVEDGWAYGCDADYLKRLCDYWLDGYDWRAAVARAEPLSAVHRADRGLRHPLRARRRRGEGSGPLILSHGWPGSHYEFWGAIDKLAWPSRHGGKAEDAFDLVIPSLPGFGFSSKPARPFGQRQTARLFNKLMTEVLGYDRYLAQGGDWGSLVTSCARLRPPGARPRHPPQHAGLPAARRPAGRGRGGLDDQPGRGDGQLGAYFRLQLSKPQSLAWLGAGNPVGQAAWIVERFYDWCDRREKPFEQVFSFDQMITNAMIYVMTGSFTTGAWYYRALVEGGAVPLKEGERLETPTAFANFPGEALYSAPPRSYAERAYNIVRWTEQPRGGHFAPWKSRTSSSTT